MAGSKYLIDIRTKGAGKSQKQVKGVSSALGGLAKKAALAAGTYFGARALLDGIKQSIDLFARQELAQKKLETVLKSTGNAVGMTSLELVNMAKSLQSVTKFGDEAIMETQALMLTFTQIGNEVMPNAIETVLNMSEAMGVGLKEQTIQLGKALNDPILGISALSRVGVQLSETQKQQIKDFMAVNDVASAQGVILGELETQFGGMAREGADTLSGSLAQMNNALGDAGEVMGETLAPIVTDLAIKVKGLAQDFQEFMRGFTETPLERSIRDMQDLGMETTDLELVLNRIEQSKATAKLTDEFADSTPLKAVNYELDRQAYFMEQRANLALEAAEITGEEMNMMEKLQELRSSGASEEEIQAAAHIVSEAIRLDLAIQASEDRMERAALEISLQNEINKLKEEEVNLIKAAGTETIKTGEIKNKTQKDESKLTTLAEEGKIKLKEKVEDTVKKSEAVSKTRKVQEALQDSYAMAGKAYKAVVEIPIVGPALAVVAAAAAMAFGLKQVGMIKSFAKGGSFVTDGPEMIMVGDNPSGREQVNVTPLGLDEGTPSQAGITLNISGNVLHESFVEDSIIPQIREGLRLGENMGV